MAFTKPYSEKTAELIDAEVKNLIEEAYQRSKDILHKHMDGLNKLAEILLEKEVIFAEDLEEIFGKRPWPSHHAKESLWEAKKETAVNEKTAIEPDVKSTELINPESKKKKEE